MTGRPELPSLLPAVYGLRDAQHRDVLRALLGVLEEQAAALENDIEALYDNWFIETCDEWVVPYIGDLLGVRGLSTVEGGGLSRRALVANTLAYRRGKGTGAMLEQVARDVTAWPARVVEFFELLSWIQNLNHVRPHGTGAIDLRDPGRLDLLNGPFESSAHVAEVRHVDTGAGRYGISNIGIHMWRLAAYPIERCPARSAGEGLYRFDQAGGDAPLFNAPVTETSIAQKAGELNVPGPIRMLRLHADLSEFKRRYVGVPFDSVPADSDLYGPARSVAIVRDGEPVSPLDVIAADLSAWDRPPPGVVGLLSGDLSSYSPPSAAGPEVAVTIGADGPRSVPLGSAPATLGEAASVLEAALRAAAPGAGFAGAHVLTAGARLFVLPGVRGMEVAITGTASDPTTAAELLLEDPAAGPGHALLSPPLSPFPQLVADSPQVDVSIAGGGPATASLAATPTSVSDAASSLEDAIRGAGSSAAFADAEVFAYGDRLLVRSGTGEAITLRPSEDDTTTARQLGLSSMVAVDPRLGRMSFALGDEPDGDILVSYNYGFGGNLGGGPYDRRGSLVAEGPGLWARTVSQQDPGADFQSLSDALAAWSDPSDGAGSDAVITIADNGAYAEEISLGPNAGRTLIVQAASGKRPRVRFEDAAGDLGELRVAAGATDAELQLDGLLIEGGIRVQAGALGTLRVRHCTLVPGLEKDPAGGPVRFGAPSLVVEEPNDRLGVEIVRSITGALEAPADMRRLDVRDSIVDSPRAASLPVVLSGSLSPFPALSAPAPRITVSIGNEGPHVCALPGIPASLAGARDLLDSAIRSAHRSPAFTGARVTSVGNRLVIVPGIPAAVSVEETGADATASELRLVAPDSSQSLAFSSRDLVPFPALSSPAPKVLVTMGDEGPHEAQLASVPTSIPQARGHLQEAIRNAHTTPAFASCFVARVGDRLVVIPGAAHTPVGFDPAADDVATVIELGLAGGGPAIAGPRGSVGAPLKIETSTVLEAVSVRELRLASESVFAARVIAARRQSGCARFSFIPLGSIVPRRFRCQPDDSASAARVYPLFSSLVYGSPGYGRLARSCAEEILAGASDEDEMGAFHFLRQQRRMKNLRVSLDEHLRFGLEAGAFLVT